MPEIGFLIFWFYFLFFSEFSCPGRVWTEFGTKISFGLSRPISYCFGYKKIPERGFLVFWFFFSIFFAIFLPGSSMNGIQDWIFSLSFSVYLIPFWLKRMPERGFSIVWIFLPFFFPNFLARVEYDRNSRLKFFSLFFSLSLPV